MTSEEQIEAGLGVAPQQRDLEADEIESRALAEQLPTLRSAPGFPAASDAAILAMSRPRGYAASPNPFGADLVSPPAKATPVRTPYATDITTGKGHISYNAHIYPTKVPHEAIMRFLLHYSEPGDLILDGFCGSGMAGVAAQACGKPEPLIKRRIDTAMPGSPWGARRAFLQDLAPNATFLAAGLNLPVDADAFDRASRDLLARFDREWGWMYATTSPMDAKATVDYTIWSEVFSCPHCASEVVFYDAAFNEATKEYRDEFLCSTCGALVSKKSLNRRMVQVTTLAGDTIERVEFRPVRIAWRAGKLSGIKALNDADLNVLRRVASTQITGFPADELPLSEMVHGSRLGPKGFSRVHHLWCDRALVSLTVLWRYAHEEADPRLRNALLFWIEQALWGLSWMNRYKPNDHSQVNRNQSGVYYVSSAVSEPSPRYNLGGKRTLLVKYWRSSPALDGLVRISTGSSQRIPLPDECVDYVFVDPPFGKNIPYSDLALVIESWHGVKTDAGAEATIDSFKHRGLPEYTSIMTDCFREFYRVLRAGRWMTVEFSNSDNSVWLGIQMALASVGFVVADTRVFDKAQHSYRQVTAANAVKQDLIISAYRPRADVAERVRLSSGSEEGVWAFIREHLAHLETVSASDIRERQVDRLFDRVVAYHVANGIAVPMSLNEFRDSIDQKFNRADGMYFLPSQEEEYQRYRLTVPHATQETAFITNEGSAVAWIRRLLETGRRTYSEIMPAYFKEVQTGLESWEAMPELRDLLSENFLQDDEGRWFIPDTTDAAQMERLHNQALLRIFAEYVKGKGKLGTVRSEAVRVGFANAWNDRDFESIYAVGRRLPEDFFVIETALHHFFRAAERHVARR